MAVFLRAFAKKDDSLFCPFEQLKKLNKSKYLITNKSVPFYSYTVLS
jgi:hypothetical protein